MKMLHPPWVMSEKRFVRSLAREAKQSLDINDTSEQVVTLQVAAAVGGLYTERAYGVATVPERAQMKKPEAGCCVQEIVSEINVKAARKVAKALLTDMYLKILTSTRVAAHYVEIHDQAMEKLG